MVNINDKIYVIKKNAQLNKKATEWLIKGNVLAYVSRTDKKFFNGKGRYIYDFRNSWESINPEKIHELEQYIKEEFYKPNPTSHIMVSSELIEFDHLWEEGKKIHRKMLEKLIEEEMVVLNID